MDDGTDEEPEEASSAISSVLQDCGLSVFCRRVEQVIFPYLNIIYDIEKIANGKQLFGMDSRLIGSAGEGLLSLSMINGTTCDLDLMCILSKCKVYGFADVCVSQQHWQFQTEPCQNNSGYVKLKVIKEGTLLTLPVSTPLSGCFKYDAISRTHYLSNAITAGLHNLTMNINFNQFFNSLQLTDALKGMIVTGPAVSRVTRREFRPGIFAVNKIDQVISIPCPIWPSVAFEWISRKRKHDWPSKNFIFEHVQQGCYVVPVGCKVCEHSDLDWRLSFVLVEQALILDFNITQVHCLCLLKQLKTFVFEKSIGDIISSYILKTVVFWTIEESPPKLWVPHRLLTTVQMCLDKLISFVQNDFCPNFFIRTCNLLATRYNFAEKKSVIQACLRARQYTRVLLCQTPPFNEAFKSQYMENRALAVVELCFPDILVQTICSLIISIIHDSFCVFFRLPLSSLQTIPTAIRYGEKTFFQLQEMQSKYDIQQQDAFNVKKHVGLMYIRLVWTNEYLTALNNKSRYRCIKVLRHKLTEMNELVEAVTFCHLNTAIGNYTISKDALGVLIAKQKCLPYLRTHISVGSFFNADDPTFLSDLVSKLGKWMFKESATQPQPIADILFLRFEMDLLPPPMQMEMCPNQNHVDQLDISSGMLSTVAVDPLVYACFLRFWCCVKLDQNIETLKARDDMVWCCSLPDITYKAVAFNLLGYCHKHLEEYDEAFRAFCMAWKQNPRSNATPVHMFVLVHSTIRRELNETSPD